jgi:hypothetical protein
MEHMGVFIPIVAMIIPIVAIYMSGKQKIARMNLEEARLRGGSLGDGAEQELMALRHEMDGLRTELSEVQERLDFTERLLARPAPSASPPGR